VSWILLRAVLIEGVSESLFLGIISGFETKKLILYCTSCEILRSHGWWALASTPSLTHHCLLYLSRPSASSFLQDSKSTSYVTCLLSIKFTTGILSVTVNKSFIIKRHSVAINMYVERKYNILLFVWIPF